MVTLLVYQDKIVKSDFETVNDGEGVELSVICRELIVENWRVKFSIRDVMFYLYTEYCFS